MLTRYVGMVVVAWISILAALIHISQKTKWETYYFLGFQLVALISMMLEAGYAETGIITKANFSLRILTLSGFIGYIILILVR